MYHASPSLAPMALLAWKAPQAHRKHLLGLFAGTVLAPTGFLALYHFVGIGPAAALFALPGAAATAWMVAADHRRSKDARDAWLAELTQSLEGRKILSIEEAEAQVGSLAVADSEFVGGELSPALVEGALSPAE